MCARLLIQFVISPDQKESRGHLYAGKAQIKLNICTVSVNALENEGTGINALENEGTDINALEKEGTDI